MEKDGFYVVEEVSEKGITKNAYHFIDGKRVRQLNGIKKSKVELLEWFNSEPTFTMNYLSPSNNKVHTYHNGDGFSSHGSIPLDSSGMVKNSIFYQVVDGKIVSEKKSLPSKDEKNFKVFSNDAKLLFSGEYTQVKEVEKGYYLLVSNDVSKIVDDKGHSVSEDYKWIGSDILNSKHFMAYNGESFCVISTKGKVEIPCSYSDMIEFKGNRYAVPDGENQKLIDLNGNVLVVIKEGKFDYNQPAYNVFSIRKNNSKIRQFWSASTEEYLDFEATRFFRFPGLEHLWKVKTDKGFLVFDEEGKLQLDAYVKSAFLHQGHFIATDYNNYSIILDLDSSIRSKPIFGEIDLIRTYSDDKEDKLFHLKSTEGNSGLIDSNGRMILKGDFSNVSYFGYGVYGLNSGYKKPVYLFTEKNGLLDLKALSFDKFSDSVLTVRTKEYIYGLWDFKKNSWVLEPSEYSYIASNNSDFGVYSIGYGLDSRSGFITKDGVELTAANYEGSLRATFNKGVNISDGDITVYELPSAKKILETEGRSVEINDYGSILVY
ncbi:hypothetical protein THO17_06800 [Marinomonas sp. THO17]